MIKLGFSIGETNLKYTQKERIKILLDYEDDAIELGFVRAERLKEELDEEDIVNINSFEFISMHSPVVSSVDKKTGEKKWVRYPSEEGEEIVDKLLEIIKVTNIKAVLFHPDLIDDFDWLNSKMGDLLAFENMDTRKNFGATIEDLETVFKKSPQAKWVCDVNHLYTMDKTMKNSGEFHQAFGDRLVYYHLSAYGGFHDLFINVDEDEDIIFKGIQDYSKPIIHEGTALRDGLISLRSESEYVLDRLGLHTQ